MVNPYTNFCVRRSNSWAVRVLNNRLSDGLDDSITYTLSADAAGNKELALVLNANILL